MSNLPQFLRLLERADVSEIAFQTGSQPAMAASGKYVPLSQVTLTPQHLAALTNAVPFAGAPSDGDGELREDVEIAGQRYSASLRRRGERVQLRFRVADPAQPGHPTAETTDAGARSPSAEPQATKATPHPRRSAETSSAETTPPRRPEAARPHSGPYTTDVDPQLGKLLADARAHKASDVHIVADRPLAVRTAGALRQVGQPITHDRAEAMLLPLLSEHRRAQLARVGYADFAVCLAGAGPFRVNVGRMATGLKGVFRAVVETIPTPEELGLPAELNAIGMYHQGLAIVSGPSGQGKTTTLASLVNVINKAKAHHILTVEDPVEVVYPAATALVSQREVGVHTASFARALKAALREDPDVIVIGELRDLETVEIALEAAETGHLVIATMSTRTGAQTITRLIDMFPPDKQSQVRATLAGALKLVVSQRLVARAAAGAGMVAVCELITGNQQLWNLIRDNKLIQLPSLMQRGRSLGMIKRDESLRDLVRADVITLETAMAAAEGPHDLTRMLAAPAPGDAAQPPQTPEAAPSKRRALGSMLGRKKG